VFPSGDDQGSWARRHAARWWTQSGTGHGDEQVAGLARLLLELRAITYRAGTCHVAVIHLPGPGPEPRPLAVGVGAWEMRGQRAARLRKLVCADDELVIEPPAVEEVRAPALGAGLRSIRYARDREGLVYGAVNWAFRCEAYETDLRFAAGCPYPGRLQAAMPDLEDLVHGTSLCPLPPGPGRG
jgi:hypothetical protein